MGHNRTINNTTMISKAFNIVIFIHLLLGVAFFSNLAIPGIKFLFGLENTVYSIKRPFDVHTAKVSIILWVLCTFACVSWIIIKTQKKKN